MRVHWWVYCGLLFSLVLVSQVTPAGACLVYFHNGTNYTVTAQYAYSSDGGATWSSYSSTGVGAGATQGINMSTGVQRKLRWYDATGGGAYYDIGTFPDAPCDQTFNYPVGPATPPNKICIYSISYTNNTTKTAQMQVYWEWPGNVVTVDPSVWALPPGAGFINRPWTNNIGTNTVCPRLWIGDTREGTTLPARYFDASSSYNATAPGPGSGNGMGGPTPGPITGGPPDPGGSGGSTNLATQGDIYRGSDMVIRGLDGLEQSMSRGLSNVVGSVDNVGGAVRQVGSNIVTAVDRSASNIVKSVDYLTNSLAGLSTNGTGTGLEGITNLLGDIKSNTAPLFGIHTNLLGIGTNIAGIGTNTAGIRDFLNGMGTNFALGTELGTTNREAFDMVVSNAINGSSFMANMENMKNYSSGLSDMQAGLANTWGAGLAPPPEGWGVLQPRMGILSRASRYQKTTTMMEGNIIFTLDLKPALSLLFLESIEPGLRNWLRLIVLWGALGYCVVIYFRKVRDAIKDSLTVPAIKSEQMWLAAMGGAVGGPVGASVGSAAGWTLKMSVMLSMLIAIAFLPSICIAIASTAWSVVGASPTYLAANVNGVLAGPTGGSLYNFLWCIAQWFPIVELCVLAINTAILSVTMDVAASVMMVYMKARL